MKKVKLTSLNLKVTEISKLDAIKGGKENSYICGNSHPALSNCVKCVAD